MKILIDMNLSPAWEERLRASNVEAAHWSSLGIEDAPDADIAAFAAANGWIVLTRDLDFGELLVLSGASLPSVIQVRCEQVVLERGVPLVLRVLEHCQFELQQGSLISLNTDNGRVRAMPLPAPYFRN